jgi:riboflavin synthase
MWMFTGIVSAIGVVVEAGPSRLAIGSAGTAKRLTIGASVAVNGCCLTVVNKAGAKFSMDVVPETLRRTALGSLTPGARVNLELPVAADGLFDGHLVQGHIDATGRVVRVAGAAAGREGTIELPTDLRKFVVEKGSIAVDGISLTVAALDDHAATFTVALIPHTLDVTIAGEYKVGSVVNLEADIVARYVARNLRR